ncbi:hypothetical protein SSX86_004250 [Deinandra increscens subsp. villosa]|uniref:Arf-GAP domain-containing protein n=1 Tax=Deinandra increscens subsp. villosa TaxID=3103831 RepID=A0AAP0DMN7_9ASTR
MSSRKEEERNEKIIRGLMKLPPNRRCINCNSLGPQYVCTNFWTFICMTCSGIHREFTHRVKSVSMSKFTSQEVESLQEGGNQRARETFLRDWDPREQRLPDNSNVDKVRDFIKTVYVDKKFFASKVPGKPPRDTLNHRNNEDETRRASSYHSYSQSPPYDYQYEERRYGKQAPALTKKPGSDRGMLRFLSTSRLSDQVQEDRFANEVAIARASDYSMTSGGDLFRSDTQSPHSLSHSSGSGKFDGLDLFSSPNSLPSATSAPFAEPGKFDGLDLFNAPNPPQSTTSAPLVEPGKFDGLDLFSAPNPPQSTTSAPLDGPGKFDGLDLFSASNPPQSAASAPSIEPEKSDGLDLFEFLATSSAFVAPTLSVHQEFKSFGPSFDLFTVMPQQQSTETLNTKSTNMITQKNEGWATFDAPWQAQPGQQDISGSVPSSLTAWHGVAHDIGAPIDVKNNNNQQPWSSFEVSTTPFESIHTKSIEQVPVQDPLVADPFLAWRLPEDRAQSHGLDIKSRNPFDLPNEADLESNNMSFDMSCMQSVLPNRDISSPWFSESAAISFTPGDSQDTLLFMAGQAPSKQFQSIQAQGPVASIGGNPFG